MSTLAVTVNGSAVSIRRNPAFIVHDVLAGTPNHATFAINSPSPAVNQDVQATLGGTLAFAGTTQQIVQTFEGQPGNLMFAITAIDYTWKLNATRPFGEFPPDANGNPQTSLTTILQQLFATYAVGFTTNNVQANLPAIAVVIDGSQDWSTVLANLTGLVGAHWYVDYTKDLHVFTLSL